LNVRFCSFGWCDNRENWASRAPFGHQVYNIVAGSEDFLPLYWRF
jgi:hypothetical protein